MKYKKYIIGTVLLGLTLAGFSLARAQVIFPFGSVKVQHSNGTWTTYQATTSSNLGRGTALLTAASSLVSNDIMFVSGNTFTLPSGTKVDLSKGSSIASTSIMGTDNTLIQGSKSSDFVIQVASSSLVQNLTVQCTNTSGFCFPVGNQNVAVKNVIIRNVSVLGTTDGFYFKNGDITPTDTIANIYFPKVSSNWDGIFLSSLGIVNIYNPIMSSVATTSVNSGQTAEPIMNSNGGVINLYNCDCSASGGSVANNGVITSGTAVHVYGGKFTTSGANAVDLNRSAGTLSVTANTNYNTTLGTITHDDSNPIIDSIAYGTHNFGIGTVPSQTLDIYGSTGIRYTDGITGAEAFNMSGDFDIADWKYKIGNQSYSPVLTVDQNNNDIEFLGGPGTPGEVTIAPTITLTNINSGGSIGANGLFIDNSATPGLGSGICMAVSGQSIGTCWQFFAKAQANGDFVVGRATQRDNMYLSANQASVNFPGPNGGSVFQPGKYTLLASAGTDATFVPIIAMGNSGQTADLFQALNSASTSLAEFTSKGWLGVGTSTPYSMVSVAGQVVAQNYVATSTTATSTFMGSMSVGGSSTDNKLQVIQTLAGGLTYPVKIQNQGGGDNSSVGILYDSDGGASNRGKGAIVYKSTVGSWGRGDFLFLNNTTADASLPTLASDEKARITNAGLFGLGTSTPYAKLSVLSGASTGDIFALSTTTGTLIGGYDNDGHRFTSGYAPVVTNGTVVGDDNGGTITTNSAISSVTITFAKPFAKTPYCKSTDDSLTISADVSSISTTAVTFSFSAPITTGHLYYECAYHK